MIDPSEGTLNQLQARVVSNRRSMIVVRTADGDYLQCAIYQKLPLVVAGDCVLVEQVHAGTPVIVKLMPRTNVLNRLLGHQIKPLAANLTRLFIVVCGRPPISDLAIDNYCCTASLSAIEPVILFNKSDLYADEPEMAHQMQARAEIYRNLGYLTHTVSGLNRTNMPQLQHLLSGNRSIFVGVSGAGKSTIINALVPDANIQIGCLSQTGVGMGTTNVTVLYHLQGGGELLDSPGVNVFLPASRTPSELGSGFCELKHYSAYCKFNDCLHLEEPECAVRAALEKHEIAPSRYQSYLSLLRQQADTDTMHPRQKK